MRAWLSRGQGVDDLRLEAVEVPSPGAGCALLQVHHAASAPVGAGGWPA